MRGRLCFTSQLKSSNRSPLRVDLVGPPPADGERPNWEEVDFIADFGGVFGDAFRAAFYEFYDDLREVFDTDILNLLIFPLGPVGNSPDPDGIIRERLYTQPPESE
jgi:hypothetical protein